MKAIWLVRKRQFARRISFWAAIVGYDPQDRSLKHTIYLAYVVIFFTIWGIAVLSLMADVGIVVLNWFSGLPPSNASVLIIALALIISTAIRGYISGVRSPFNFSETDAELICQTPLDRRQVAIAWGLENWVSGSAFFAVISIILSFASQQLIDQGEFNWVHLPAYILTGIKTASIVILLQITLITLCSALGALRLREDRENRWLRWIPVGSAVVLILIGSRSFPLSTISQSPLFIPLQSAFGVISWLPGFVVAILSAILSLLVLYWASARLNLSRAAQESRGQWSAHQLTGLGNAELSQEMKVRQKLGVGHEATRLPGMSGVSSIIWKHGVAATRVVNFGSILRWLAIPALCMIMLIGPDWGTRLWAFIFWSLQIAQQGIAKLRTDLKVWTLTRQLPFTATEFVLVECISPALIAFLLCFVAFEGVSYFGFTPQIYLIVMLPVAILCITFSASFDVLRQCRSSYLMNSWVADLGPLGIFLGLIFAGIPIFLVSTLTASYPALGMDLLIIGLGIIIGGASAYGFWRLAVIGYRNIK